MKYFRILLYLIFSLISFNLYSAPTNSGVCMSGSTVNFYNATVSSCADAVWSGLNWSSYTCGDYAGYPNICYKLNGSNTSRHIYFPNNICPDGSTYDEQTYTCTDPPPPECGVNEYYDGSACVPISNDPDCPNGGVYDSLTKTCSTQINCALGYTVGLNGFGEAACIKDQCPSYQYWNGISCDIIQEGTECPEGKVKNESHQCVNDPFYHPPVISDPTANTQDCADGFTWDGQACSFSSSLTPSCSAGFTYSSALNECIADPSGTSPDYICPNGQYYDGTTCVNNPDPVCPTGQYWNGFMCLDNTATCPPGTHDSNGVCVSDLTPNTNPCQSNETLVNGVCIPNTGQKCPEGSTYQNGLCITTNVTCPPGTIKDALGQCVTTDIPSCPDGTTLVNGQCIKPVTCPAGYTLANNTCTLNTTTSQCPDGSTPVNGVCTVSTICSDGSTPVNGQCVKPTICPDGTTKNGDQCLKRAVCPDGFSLTESGTCEAVAKAPCDPATEACDLANYKCSNESQEATCNGDPINCANFKLLFAQNCANVQIPITPLEDEEIKSIFGDDAYQSPVTNTYNFADSLDFTGFGLPSNCPAPTTYSLGKFGTLKIDLSPFCQIAEIISFLVMFTASIISIRVLGNAT